MTLPSASLMRTGSSAATRGSLRTWRVSEATAMAALLMMTL
jgi:hypothetical protein